MELTHLIQTIKYIFRQPLVVSFLAVVTSICFYYIKRNKNVQKKYIWTVYFSIFAGTALVFIGSALYRILNPQIWDFSAFYLWGKTAANGLNFYLPENLALVYNSINLPFSHSELKEFVDYIVNVGFLYPPPTILYFLPLGFLSFQNSMIVWTIFNFIFALGSIYLIFTLFFKPLKLNGLILVAILFMILRPSLSNINYLQTNFILLFLLLLMRKYSEKDVGGIFLSIAFLTKPFMLIFIVYFLLQRKWKAIIYFIAPTVALTGIILILFGKEPFISYLLDNPSLRLPKIVFYEGVNQSLNAVLIRHNIIVQENPSTYFFIIAGIILIAGAYLIFLSGKRLYDYICAILLLVGLLIYPGTLIHYGTLLLFIIFQFFDEKNQLGFKEYFTIIIVAIFYYLSTISVFTAICFLLCLVIIKSLSSLKPASILNKAIG